MGKRIATDPVQLNTQNLRRLLGFPQGPYYSVGRHSPRWNGVSNKCQFWHHRQPSWTSGRKSVWNRRGKMEGRAYPTSPMPRCLLLTKLDDSHRLRRVKVIVTPEKVNLPIRFYFPKGEKPSPFHISPRHSRLMFRGDLDLAQKLLLA